MTTQVTVTNQPGTSKYGVNWLRCVWCKLNYTHSKCDFRVVSITWHDSITEARDKADLDRALLLKQEG